MIPPKTILVATDFSDASGLALTYGKELARQFASTLHLLHVVGDADVSPGTEALWGFSETEVQRRWVDGATAKLEGLCSAEERTAFAVRTAVEVGSPAGGVVRYAGDHRVDLIVMGTRGARRRRAAAAGKRGGRGRAARALCGSDGARRARPRPCGREPLARQFVASGSAWRPTDPAGVCAVRRR